VKRFLPKLHISLLGFTLIELMIVISIIAVLSMFAVSIYNGSQAGARDARRRIEIAAIAKNIEAAKDPANGKYLYNSILIDLDYPPANSQLPHDPGKYVYCIKTETDPSNPPPAVPTNWQSSNCPTVDGYNEITLSPIADITSSVRSWTLCASLERASQPYCVTSFYQ
jgi:prepilin-type N-terminal cleavage/methylation domain-containing protein